MLPKLLRALPLAPLLVLLAGCCANTACDCRDSLADSLFFAFDSTFSRTELDTVYIARYSKASGTQTTQATDSLPLLRRTRVPSGLGVQITFESRNDTTGLVVISNSAPFSQSGTSSNLSSYSYRLYVLRDGSRTDYYRYVVDKVVLTGRYQADGCCTCYRNSQKIVSVRSVDARGNTITTFLNNGAVTDKNNDSAPRTPIVIRLTK